jgi:hypothetical protein
MKRDAGIVPANNHTRFQGPSNTIFGPRAINAAANTNDCHSSLDAASCMITPFRVTIFRFSINLKVMLGSLTRFLGDLRLTAAIAVFGRRPRKADGV